MLGTHWDAVRWVAGHLWGDAADPKLGAGPGLIWSFLSLGLLQISPHWIWFGISLHWVQFGISPRCVWFGISPH